MRMPRGRRAHPRRSPRSRRGSTRTPSGLTPRAPPSPTRGTIERSLKPLASVTPPAGAETIDAFVRAKLAESGLTPAPAADARTLIPPALFRSHRPAADARGSRYLSPDTAPSTPTRALVERLLTRRAMASAGRGIGWMSSTTAYARATTGTSSPQRLALPRLRHRALNARTNPTPPVQGADRRRRAPRHTADGIEYPRLHLGRAVGISSAAEVRKPRPTENRPPPLTARRHGREHHRHVLSLHRPLRPVPQPPVRSSRRGTTTACQAVFSALDRTDREYYRDDARNARFQKSPPRAMAGSLGARAALRTRCARARRPTPSFTRRLELPQQSTLQARLAAQSQPTATTSALSPTPDATKWVQVDLGESIPNQPGHARARARRLQRHRRWLRLFRCDSRSRPATARSSGPA